jgi:hypothetical protein
MTRPLVTLVVIGAAVATLAAACRPPSDARPPSDGPTPLAPEAIPVQAIPGPDVPLTDPEPPTREMTPPAGEPTEHPHHQQQIEGEQFPDDRGAMLGFGGGFHASVTSPVTATATAVTATTATATTTTGSGIEVSTF